MFARKITHADHIRVLVNGGLHDPLRRLIHAQVNDFHSSISQKRCNDLSPAVVAVKTHLADDNPDFVSGHSRLALNGSQSKGDAITSKGS